MIKFGTDARVAPVGRPVGDDFFGTIFALLTSNVTRNAFSRKIRIIEGGRRQNREELKMYSHLYSQ